MQQIFAKTAAISLIVVGAVVFPLPIPLGLPMIAVGSAILFGRHPRFLAWLRSMRKRSVRIEQCIAAIRTRSPRFIRDVIEETDTE